MEQDKRKMCCYLTHQSENKIDVICIPGYRRSADYTDNTLFIYLSLGRDTRSSRVLALVGWGHRV